MGKMSNKMVALCSAAVGAVYMSGYIATNTTSHALAANNDNQAMNNPSDNAVSGNSDDNKLSLATNNTENHDTRRHHHHDDDGGSHQTQTTVSAQSKSSSSSQTKTSTNKVATTSKTTTSTPKKTTSSQSSQKYKDGTFYGIGSRRIGSVEVAVKLKKDKITAVTITNCTTSYPEAYIDGLPREVLAKQSTNIDLVSGATLSSESFRDAVAQALQKAKN